MQWWRQRVAEVVVVILTSAFPVGLTQWVPFVGMAENWLGDYRIATLTPSAPQSPDIVIVTITDETLALFPYRSPVNRHFMSDLLKTLDASGVKAIGVDILFDQPTEQAKDDELKATIRNLRAPIVIGYIGDGEGLSEDQTDYLDEFLPPELRAYVTLVKDPLDTTVRQMYPGRVSPSGAFIKGFPLVLAEKLRPGQTFHADEIVWRGIPSKDVPPFRKFPAHTVKVMPKEWLKDKIVLVGADVTLTDRHRTPLAASSTGIPLIPGIDIHAHALSQLLEGRHAQEPSLAIKIVLAVAVAILGVLLAQMPTGLAVKIAVASTITVGIWVSGFALYRYHGTLIPLAMPTLALGGAWWAAEIEGGRRERQLKQFLKDAFSRYMSPSLVNQLVADPGKLALGGERREMTFLFTDIAGFTTLSEKIEPTALGTLLNEYFNGICTIIMDEGGTVVDFIGDAVFAIFGAPIAQPDHAARAINCARRIDAFSTEFRQHESARQWSWGETRIGVHLGHALVGNFGSDLKFKYAPVGDAVNTGSRLEGLNKVFGTRICVSEPAAVAAKADNLRPLGRFIFLGKGTPVTVFEPVDENWASSSTGQHYLAGYAAMAEGRTNDAIQDFEAVINGQPDPCAAFHINRLQSGETSDLVEMRQK